MLVVRFSIMDVGSGLFAFLRSWVNTTNDYQVLFYPNLIVIIECCYNDHVVSFLENNTILSSGWVLTSVWFVGWALRASPSFYLFIYFCFILCSSEKNDLLYFEKTSSCQELFYEIFGSFFFHILANLVLEKTVKSTLMLTKK